MTRRRKKISDTNSDKNWQTKTNINPTMAQHNNGSEKRNTTTRCMNLARLEHRHFIQTFPNFKISFSS